MQVHDQLARMDAQQLREFAAGLIEAIASKDHELRYKELKIEQRRYLKDVLERLPTQPASRIHELLPHSWAASPSS